ncbi:MAG TPA: bifunctional UDP-N-acetylglucosamine diphosphorylase/glucosamine-1-phosphate N-acetyltransferase GlmU [Anaerolineaceae bacterium]|nr:bifunctional UDP-N-acetylglucosamine diphosphorylase/glucosamine-1-phosphate N-acetyltransferase GlmU [Chloroflexota bacterium]HNS07780.1 bifunctional UDP-N-acetylglucosamine diphosphorylase/glucosamine-1-phosphate N-acetyltransferase GlmU [Anaerolineaceae bacterium]HPD62399.1 bifunctional UDP-N-acetylglucosamine diphosphorylase/glucosamine-1-phosphate N-acetyltransferase GlmU [Anaerolineaceae bacterium]HUM62497.1 bifunctional UDP-N-acetylglucosamine diphosphorylase/glucosamine-1-phosphate N-
MNLSTIILAAGQGTRMNSTLPKVLHPLNGKPLVKYSIDLADALSSSRTVVVIGNGAEQVRSALGESVAYALQPQRLGTANAVQAAEGLLADASGLVLVISADMPLLTADTLQRLVTTQSQNTGPMALLTVRSANPRGFGRILRGVDGGVTGIVEEAQATAEQLKIDELNVGAYCFNSSWLWQALWKIQLSPKGEYYLTDIVAVAVAEGSPVSSLTVTDEEETLGINNRVHLAEAERVIRRRINQAHMLAGVSMTDPELVYIEESVKIGRDTILLPNTWLSGSTIIGEGCEIGPNTFINDSTIGNHCHLLASVVEGAVVEDEVGMGPFCHLRKGAHLGRGVHMGNFGEVKDSYLAAGVKMGHFSYIGNATIGENVNIGAGTITCNFDGVNKNPTEIGENTFIGSDTMLVAPVVIGKNAKTAAGAVVTHDVADNEVVAGVPARPMKKKE